MPKHSDWLSFADHDLKSAEVLLGEGLIAASLYHCQQAVEKALKAFLVSKEHEPRKTHDLIGLTRLCMQELDVFEDILEDVVEINPFATQTRYPDDYYHMPDLDYARLTFNMSERIVTFVKIHIE